MIDMIYNNETQQMKNIINAKSIVQNFSYKIRNDLNSKHFFENIVKNIRNYASLERMEKYYFEKDLIAMREVLHLLYSGLQSIDYIKRKTAQEMIKACNVFPDYIGKRMIMQISYIPLIDLFYEDFKYREFIDKKINLEVRNCGGTILEDQQERLFNKKSIFNNKFPKDEDFIDYKMRNNYVDILKQEYDDKRKEEISFALNILLLQYENSKNIEETSVLIGATYWENKQKVQSTKIQSFKDALEAMVCAFDKDKNEKINKLEIILNDKISQIINPIGIEELKLTVENEKGIIKLITKSPLENSHIEEITKIFIIKSKMELVKIILKQSSFNENFEFQCEIEL